MKTNQRLIPIMMAGILIQMACGISGTTTPPRAPSQVPTLEDICPSPTARMGVLTNTEEGYCLLYPAEYSTTVSHFIVINPISSPGDMPGDAWLNIAVAPASGRTAAQFADEAITAAGDGFNITSFDRDVDGEQAVVVDGLPGQDSARYVFIVHNDRLYNLVFTPWYPNAADPTPLEDLFTMVMDTFRFL
ncbi:MAG: hypothetical protein K8S20_05275 [Chloroflexi bacterium]|nr:hypothetical protein [Chloroflexota bacterium]